MTFHTAIPCNNVADYNKYTVPNDWNLLLILVHHMLYSRLHIEYKDIHLHLPLTSDLLKRVDHIRHSVPYQSGQIFRHNTSTLRSPTLCKLIVFMQSIV